MIYTELRERCKNKPFPVRDFMPIKAFEVEIKMDRGSTGEQVNKVKAILRDQIDIETMVAEWLHCQVDEETFDQIQVKQSDVMTHP